MKFNAMSALFVLPILGGVTLTHPVSVAAAQNENKRSWTPADSVALRYFSVDPSTLERWPTPRMPGRVDFSPDGKYFFIVSHRGDLASDKEVYRLQVFKTDDVRARLENPKPAAVPALAALRDLTFSSTSSEDPALRLIKWNKGGQELLFAGTDDKSILQLFRFDVATGELSQVSRLEHDVSDIRSSGSVVVFSSHRSIVPWEQRYPAFMISRDAEGMPIAVGRESWNETYVAHEKGPPVAVNLKSAGVWLAPSGRLAVGFQDPAQLPLAWKRYERFRELDERGLGVDVWQDSFAFSRFMLADLKSGEVKAMVDAPIGMATLRLGKTESDKKRAAAMVRPNVLWSADEERLILVNTALPLIDGADAKDERESTGYIVEYEVKTGKWAVLEPLVDRGNKAAEHRVTSVGWVVDGKELLVTHALNDQDTSGTVYSWRGSQWAKRTVSQKIRLPARKVPGAQSKPDIGITVAFKQSANDAPAVVASNGHREIILSEPDPVIQEAWLARNQPVTWVEPNGKTSTAGLMLPRNFKLGQRVPLVIQVYHYYPSVFLPDGETSTTAAAQPLVAKGIAVLQLETMDTANNTFDEPPNVVERIDRVIEKLASDGIVDPERVGLTGFSRGGFQVFYTITHAGRNPIAAAVCADAWAGSYAQYLVMGGAGSENSSEKVLGGPFWTNKSVWLERETTFNVDRVNTPLLVTANGGTPYPDGSREIVGAFALNRKPLEQMYFPKGAHVLIRPRERFAAIEAIVDWMAFWLKGEESGGDAKKQQYVRWGVLREQQRASLQATQQVHH